MKPVRKRLKIFITLLTAFILMANTTLTAYAASEKKTVEISGVLKATATLSYSVKQQNGQYVWSTVSMSKPTISKKATGLTYSYSKSAMKSGNTASGFAYVSYTKKGSYIPQGLSITIGIELNPQTGEVTRVY